MTRKDANGAAGDAGRPVFSPWWREGLAFSCLGCGRCCRRPGAVFVTPEQVAELARRLDEEEGAFVRRALTNRYRYPSLTEGARGCVLLNRSDRCSCYDLRPVPCATWPFWPGVLESRAAWDEAAKSCPGMNGGAWHDAEEIEARLQETLDWHQTLKDCYSASEE